MGPNLYACPGGGFTRLHQDGHGTVDSGHTNINGYNEVVMLRRLPERHKQYASKLLFSEYDALYGLPHNDAAHEQGKRSSWPRNEVIAEWKAMG